MSELLLLSGGIDSIAIAAWRRPETCLTIDYGQKPAQAEITASATVCQALGLRHVVLHIPIGNLGSGVMAGTAPTHASVHVEFWPFRNQVLITLAAMYALRFNHSRVLIGTVKTDRRHVDGTPQFVDGIAQLVRQQEGAIDVEAPALALDSAELVAASGVTPNVLGWAHSCHTSTIACGACPGCTKHSLTMTVLGYDR